MEAKICDSPYKYTQIWVVFPYFYQSSVMLSKFVWGAKLIFSWGTVISRVVVQPLSHVSPFATPGTTALQASLSFTISRSLLNLMSIELVMPSNHLILCCTLLFLPSIFPSVRVFPNESVFTSGGQSIGASTSASVFAMNIQDWFPLGLTGLISLVSKRLSRVFSSNTIQKHQFFSSQPSLW